MACHSLFFLLIILARNTLCFIEDIKLERLHSALTWLAHARNSGAQLQGAYPGRNGRSLDSFFPEPMCPGMSICINSLGYYFESSYIVELTQRFLPIIHPWFRDHTTGQSEKLLKALDIPFCQLHVLLTWL